MAMVKHSKGHASNFLIFLANKGHVLYSTKGINKRVVKSGLHISLEVKESARTVICILQNCRNHCTKDSTIFEAAKVRYFDLS